MSILTLGSIHICFELLIFRRSMRSSWNDSDPVSPMKTYVPRVVLHWLEPPAELAGPFHGLHPPLGGNAHSHSLLPRMLTARGTSSSILIHRTCPVMRKAESYMCRLLLRENAAPSDPTWFKNSFSVKERRSKPCLKGAAATELCF